MQDQRRPRFIIILLFYTSQRFNNPPYCSIKCYRVNECNATSHDDHSHGPQNAVVEKRRMNEWQCLEVVYM